MVANSDFNFAAYAERVAGMTDDEPCLNAREAIQILCRGATELKPIENPIPRSEAPLVCLKGGCMSLSF